MCSSPNLNSPGKGGASTIGLIISAGTVSQTGWVGAR
jgi:hypothetical protein